MAYFTQQRIHSSAYARLFGWALLAPLILGLSANTARAQACIATPPGAIYWLAGDNSFDDQVGFHNGSSLGTDVAFVPGQVGEAMSFDGVDDVVFVDVTPAEQQAQRVSFSYELWARPTSSMTICTESNSGLCGQGLPWAVRPRFGPDGLPPGGDAAGIGIAVGTNGICVGQHALDIISCLATVETTINDWTHIAVVVENKTPRIYRDGVLVRTGIASTKPFVFTSFDHIGSAETIGNYSGDLDELTIYDRALTDDEIAVLFAAGIDGKCKDDCGFQRHDDAWEGALVTDHTPLRPGSTADCMLGAITCVPEPLSTLFADSQPADTVHAFEWQTHSSIKVDGFSLFALHDPGNNLRAFNHVRVQAREIGGTFETIYESPIVVPYGQFDQGRELRRCLRVRPVQAQQFRAEFTQAGAAGPRVYELDGVSDTIFIDDFD